MLDRHAYLLYDATGELEGMARFLDARGMRREAVAGLNGRDEPAALHLTAWIYESFTSTGADHGSMIEWGPWDDGHPDVALEYYCRAAAAGHAESVVDAVRVLQESGLSARPAEVAKAIEALAPWKSAEDTDVLAALVELYELAGRDEDAAGLQRRIDADHERFRTELGTRTDPDGIRYFQRAAEAGDTRAWSDAAWRADLARVREYGLEPGGRVSPGWSPSRSR
jgi:TPR repeat protein